MPRTPVEAACRNLPRRRAERLHRSENVAAWAASALKTLTLTGWMAKTLTTALCKEGKNDGVLEIPMGKLRGGTAKYGRYSEKDSAEEKQEKRR
jgi:hypothetical protein